MNNGFKTLESKKIFEGKIISLYLDTIESPSGRRMEREVVKHLDAVGIAAINSKKQMIFVRQYRHATGKELLEIPAGLIDDENETPESCAIRELKEETGYIAKNVKKLCEFYTTVGFTNEKLHLYFADSIESGLHAREAEEEGMVVEEIDMEMALKMAIGGEIEDSKTLIAILMTARRVCP